MTLQSFIFWSKDKETTWKTYQRVPEVALEQDCQSRGLHLPADATGSAVARAGPWAADVVSQALHLINQNQVSLITGHPKSDNQIQTNQSQTEQLIRKQKRYIAQVAHSPTGSALGWGGLDSMSFAKVAPNTFPIAYKKRAEEEVKNTESKKILIEICINEVQHSRLVVETNASGPPRWTCTANQRPLKRQWKKEIALMSPDD